MVPKWVILRAKSKFLLVFFCNLYYFLKVFSIVSKVKSFNGVNYEFAEKLEFNLDYYCAVIQHSKNEFVRSCKTIKRSNSITCSCQKGHTYTIISEKKSVIFDKNVYALSLTNGVRISMNIFYVYLNFFTGIFTRYYFIPFIYSYNSSLFIFHDDSHYVRIFPFSCFFSLKLLFW